MNLLVDYNLERAIENTSILVNQIHEPDYLTQLIAELTYRSLYIL